MSDKKKFIMFDFGHVLARYVDPKENFDRCIICLTQGKCLDEVADYFNILPFYKKTINSEDYKKLNPKVAPYVLGEQLLEELKNRGILNDGIIIKARMAGIELIDPEIIEKVEKYTSRVIPVIGSQNGQDAHDLFDALFPEMERRRQIVSTDSDINSRKDKLEFYGKAAQRLKTITSEIILLDDEQKNIDAMEQAGGFAKLFKENVDNLADSAYEAIEQLVKRK